MDFFNLISEHIEAFIISIVVIGIIATIYTNVFSPSESFLSATLILILTGVIEVSDLLISFSNAQVFTIFLLIFITVAIQTHVNVNVIFNKLFPTQLSHRLFVLRLSTIVVFFSSFLNNTPIVAMLTSNVQNWASKKKVSPSKFLIPLSYAALLGGMITVIGTSTNLVLQGLLSSNGEELLKVMDFLVVGLAVSLAGIIYLSIFSGILLPNRKLALKQFTENRGEYIHEVELEPKNSLVGNTVANAGLKNLQGIYLVEISRKGELITPVAPDIVIEEGDHFYFAGDTEQLVEFVRNKRGLMLSSEKKLQKVGEGDIVEVMVAANSKLSGVQVKDSNFRQNYNASIIGIHRNGEKVSGKIGHLKLKSGDLLLLLAGSDFFNRIRDDKSLYLLTEIAKAFNPPVVRRKWIYAIIQALVAVLLLKGVLSFLLALFVSLFLLLLFRYLNVDSLKRNFDIDLLIVLACSLTIGKAFIKSGAAEIASTEFLEFIPPDNIRLALLILFVFTAILTSLITNVAAVSISFPVAYALSNDMGFEGAPFYLTIAFAASAAFLTPMAYQTNMMVYGPGGYKSIDFLKLGLPLLIIYMAVSLFMIFWWYGI